MHKEYKNLIDDLAGLYSEKLTIPVERALEDLGLSDNVPVRQLLFRARQSALHDVAAYLQDQLAAGEATLNVRGEQITGSPYATMQYDLTCRLEGDDWPKEGDD